MAPHAPLIIHRLPPNLSNDIKNFNQEHLKPIPLFGIRKGEWQYEDLPVDQLLEDIIAFVQAWSQRERLITTRLTIKTLKKKLAELQWAQSMRWGNLVLDE